MIVADIKTEEGFVGYPYNDSLGFPTIGYGTKLPLDREEAELLLRHRLNKYKRELRQKLDLHISQEAWEILDHMVYQMGVGGVLNFKKMIAALKAKDYNKAADEMLDSKWAKQTPARATRLADRMRAL